MADVWANSITCHPRATCHIAGCSHLAISMSWSRHIAGCNLKLCNNSIPHIENGFSPYFILFLFFNAVWVWQAAAFVSSPIHLYRYRQVLGCDKIFALGGVRGRRARNRIYAGFLHFSGIIWRSYGRISMKLYAPKITEKRVNGFAWNVAHRQISEHGRTD